jgi:protein-tyrosine phosphatase
MGACTTLRGMERAELHFHLLPGVDDGPSDLATALDLAREAVADGTGLVVCTPHAHMIDVAELPERVRELRAALAAADIDLEIRRGAELSWDHVARYDDPMLAAVAQGPPGRRWILLEAPLPGTGDLEDFEPAAQELRDRGYRLLVGHPERSPAMLADPDALDRIVEAGDRVQVNASSLIGYHGKGARAAAIEIVRSGRADVLASDAHQPFVRGPALTRAVAVLREHGVADVDRLTSSEPRALLERGIASARRLAA